MAFKNSFGTLIQPAVYTPLICFLYFFLRHYSLTYLVGGISILVVFYFLYFSWEKVKQGFLAGAFLSIVAVSLLGLGLWQFLQLQDPGDVDHASYACALWNMAHGRTYYSINDMNFFGNHADYTGLLWIPVHAAMGEFGLKLGKCLCLLIASWLAVRRFWSLGEIACLGAAAILLSPPIASQFFNGFHLEFLAAPVLILALDAYREKKLGRFLVCTFFLAYSKEVFTLAIAGILLVALVERRPWKWLVLPAILCCVQMGVYWFLIVPHFAPKGNNLGPFMPVSAGQVLSLWAHPRTYYYFLNVVLPFLPLMLALPKRYLFLPLPLMAFYACFPDPLFLSMWAHYPFPLAFLCFSGLILFEGAPSPSGKPFGGFSGCAMTDRGEAGKILMACAVTSLLCYPIWRKVFTIPAPDFARVHEVLEIRSLVPDDASILISAPFTSLFASRRNVSDWVYRKRPVEDYDFIVMDGRFTSPFHVEKARQEQDIQDLRRSPNWSLAFMRDDLFLFHNNQSRW